MKFVATMAFSVAVVCGAESAQQTFDNAVRALTQGEYNAAERGFQTVLREKPNDPDAHNNLGFALINIPGRMNEAIAEFEAAIRINPGYADAQYNLGMALSQIPGKMPEAIAHMEAAYRANPDPEIRRSIDRMHELER